MNKPFKVGDICIGQNMVWTTHYNGMDCEIVGPLELRRIVDLSKDGQLIDELCYHVRWADGEETAVPPEKLRRKPPKPDTDAWAMDKVQQLLKPLQVDA